MTMNMSMRFIISRNITTKVSDRVLGKVSAADHDPHIDTREEDLTHPEDIEHFRKHDEMDAAAERQEQLDKMQIVEQNIPQKFRRH